MGLFGFLFIIWKFINCVGACNCFYSGLFILYIVRTLWG